MNQNMHHECLIIPKELSHFDEEEVLIFPFFYFEVMKVTENKNNKSESYNIVQKPTEGDEKDIRNTQSTRSDKKGEQL